MENQFFTLLNTDQNAPKKNQNSNFIALYQKTSFGFDTGPLEVPRPENTQICVFAHFRIFCFGHFPRSGIESKNSFLKKVLYNYCSKFFLERFGQYLQKEKKWISHCILKKGIWVGWGGIFFNFFFLLKKPNNPEYAQVLVVTCPKLNSVTALLSLPPKQQKATKLTSCFYIPVCEYCFRMFSNTFHGVIFIEHCQIYLSTISKHIL